MKRKLLSVILAGAMICTGLSPTLSVRAESGGPDISGEAAQQSESEDGAEIEAEIEVNAAEENESQEMSVAGEESAETGDEGTENSEAVPGEDEEMKETEELQEESETASNEEASEAKTADQDAEAKEKKGGKTVEVNGSEYEYSVVLPSSYEESAESSYPVVYLMPEDGYASWTSGMTDGLTAAMSTGQSMDMILVLPTFDKENDFRTVLQAVVQRVDEEYRTVPDAAHRATVGVGIGGYMAYIAALTDAATGEAMTAPSTFGLMSSIRGDFVSDANPWHAVCGDVYDTLMSLRAASEKFYYNYYTYMDTPVNDAYASMPHSTNDMARLFINWEKSIPNYHEYTARPGGYDSAYLAESLNRTMNRYTKRFLSGIVTGSVKLERAAMTAQEEGTNAKYAFTISDSYAALAGNAKNETKIKLQVKDPATGEVLYEKTVSQQIEGPGNYEGTIPVNNIVNGSSSIVQVTMELLGTVQDVGSATMIRIKDIGENEDEKLIDLMGDWYFNYVGMQDPYKAEALTPEVYEAWSVVQPCLGGWEAGYGNITNIWWRNIGWGWYVRTFTIPEDFSKENLTLVAGYMDDRGEVYINGIKVGATGLDENGVTTGETTWAVLSQFGVDSEILNYGGTNTIAVHCYNDPPYGGGGWYNGPVGLYSQAAYNKWLGLPSEVPSETEQQSVEAAVKAQLDYLQKGDFDKYAETIDYDYFSDGITKNMHVQQMKEKYPAGTIESISDTNSSVYQTTNSNGEILYLYSAMRKVELKGKEPVETLVKETYRNTDKGILMYGVHSRFYETSYESSKAASAQGMEEGTTADERYLVYLPEGYFETDRYYPTVYLLHQYNSDHTSYKTDNVDALLDEGMRLGLFDDMIVVVPNSAEVSWWRGDWEKMITDELIPMIDANYRTIRDARYRLTAGASMGGQGAYGVALRNPEYFSGAISFFGAFSMGGENSPNKIAAEESADYMNYFTLYFICGNEDLYGFGSPAIELNQLLNEKGVDHFFLIENGDHNSEFYIPYFQHAFAYTREKMYHSDPAILNLISGKAEIKKDGDQVKLLADVTFADGIEAYKNVIPTSSYTNNTVQDISVPLMLQVVQGGKVVYEDIMKDVMITEADTIRLGRDVTGIVDPDQEYEIIWKAAVFDLVKDMLKKEVVEPDQNTDKKPAGDEGTSKPGTTAQKKPASNAVKTGDTENLAGIYGMLVLSAAVIAVSAMMKRRQKR